MAPNLNKDFFDNNAARLFALRKALTDDKLKDEHLDDEETVRRFIRHGVGIRNKITSVCCESFKNYLLSQGGVEAYLKKPVFLANIYVAMALYNLKIQTEIVDLTTFGDLSSHEAQRLLSGLLGEEEIADEVGAHVYKSVCRNISYKRAEDAIKKYYLENNDVVTAEAAGLVKTYLCDCLNVEVAKLSPFQRGLIASSKKSQTNTPKASNHEDLTQQQKLQLVEVHEQSSDMVNEKSPIKKSYVKVERLSSEFDPWAKMQTDEDDLDVVSTVENGSQRPTTTPRKQNIKKKKLLGGSNGRSDSTHKSKINVVGLHRLHYKLRLRQKQLEQREAEVAIRELTCELREKTLTLRENMLVQRSKIFDTRV